MLNKIHFLCLAFAITSPSWSQTSEPEDDSIHIKWGISAGANRYTESELMQLKGPELGVHASLSRWTLLPEAFVEGDILLGQQTYTSKNLGSMRGVTNLETRWRTMVPLFSDALTDDNLASGLALHTLWNDLRGTTTFQGVTYSGYQRSAAQLWLPVRWQNGEVWTLDAGWLIYGQHTSKLSEVSARYQDVVNTQRKGQYAQVTVNFFLDNGDSLKPFVRFTHLANSNAVAMGGRYWIEPASQRLQLGVLWEFAAP